MRHNGRPAIRASAMRPDHLSLRDGEPRLAVCPDCDTWHRLTRSMIKPHRDSIGTPKTEERRYFGDKPTGGSRCPGSAQRIIIDLTPEEWGEKLLAAETTAASRRTARPSRKPQPVIPMPVARLAAVPKATRLLALLTQARTAIDTHRAGCTAECSRRGRCETARELETYYAEISATYTLALEQQDRQEQTTVRSQARQRAAQWREAARKADLVDRERASLGR